MATIGRRKVLVGAGAMFASPAWAQAPPTKPKVAITTGQGLIVVELEAQKAPITSANFLRYVDGGRYDRGEIYRAMRTKGAPETGLIEGGPPNDPRGRFPPIAHEPTSQTGLKHLDGTISLARFAPGSGTADFFICVGPQPGLDADPTLPGDNLGFAAFGQVTQGMDVVRAILALPTGGVARNPTMAGQILSPPVQIVSMRRMG
jgi:peptidyl-prolyl cis-trans isomerase A (cyclophilin A)